MFTKTKIVLATVLVLRSDRSPHWRRAIRAKSEVGSWSRAAWTASIPSITPTSLAT